MAERFEHAGSVEAVMLSPRAKSLIIGGRVEGVGCWIDTAQCQKHVRNEIVAEIVPRGGGAFDAIEVAHCY